MKATLAIVAMLTQNNAHMRHFLTLVIAWIITGCSEPKVQPPAVDGQPFSRAFELKLDGKMLFARVAVTEMEKSQGLMGVTSTSDEGMLFVYPANIRARFWMKDTPTDLDIAFFDREGVLLKVASMRAYDTEVTDSGVENVRFALEMRAGWFRDSGMKEGAKLDLYSVVNALRERGFNPTKLGL